MHTATSYQISVSSRHPHVAARIRAIVATSEHNEDSLAEHEYELYECGDEVLLISVNRHDQFQTTMEYEADNTPSALSSASVSASPNTSPSASPSAHSNFLQALKGFPDTSVRVLEEKVI